MFEVVHDNVLSMVVSLKPSKRQTSTGAQVVPKLKQFPSMWPFGTIKAILETMAFWDNKSYFRNNFHIHMPRIISNFQKHLRNIGLLFGNCFSLGTTGMPVRSLGRTGVVPSVVDQPCKRTLAVNDEGARQFVRP